MPTSTRPLDQKAWLVEKFELFKEHHNKKTLGQFFPPLYEECFSKWPLNVTEEGINAAGGKTAVATAKVRSVEEHRIYRWMFNRSRSKHGSSGNGSLAGLNLTAGLPKKKAAVQTYVKHFWVSKVQQKVIDSWAPTPETDLFGEIDIGEDQVAWEEMTPMEKNIPLWFQMEIGRKLYEAESDEVKAEVDRLREQGKEDAVAVQASSNMFTTDEERLQVMSKFGENFPKLGHSLRNLCSNIKRDFGFHTSIIVGGPLIRENGRLNVFTYESHGSIHKQLTFSEYMGKPYDNEVSEKFVEYLNVCISKEERKLYTLKPLTATAETPSSTFNAPVAPVAPVPKPPPLSHAAGPIRTSRTSSQGRMRNGPMTPALKARTLANMAKSKANDAFTLPIEAESIETAEAAEPIQSTFISGPLSDHQPPLSSQFIENDISNPSSYTLTPPDVFTGMGDSIASQSLENNVSDRLSHLSMLPNVLDVRMDGPPSSQTLENGVPDRLSQLSVLPDVLGVGTDGPPSDIDFSDSLSYASLLPDDFDVEMDDSLSNDSSESISYTSTLSDVFDIGMDDSAPPATGPWMIIDHFTGEIIVDEEVPSAIPGASPDSVIQVEVVPALGVPALVQTPPPNLLFADQDERPDWLIRSTKKHLQYTPYYMRLSKVVDLFFVQEARLGYPDKSPRLALPAQNRPTEVAVFMKYGRDFTRGDAVDAERFGKKVLEWWLTIQPTTRKAWPQTYEPLPEDFSFDYFKRGGPNGVFLMILCLTWWANALTPYGSHTSFWLVVEDVCWVLEQVASCA